jgi:acetylornithine/succinyldiaminopimelate/putrescine aminotransferase
MVNIRKVVVSARNATLYNIDGSSHTDLFGANGTLLLGHCNPAVVEALEEQSRKVWITGRLDTDIRLEAVTMVERVIPGSHYVSGFYSTGMEASEFALRAARVLTGRKDLLGFAKSMHGKSLATAFLAWNNPHGHGLPGFVRPPFPSPDQAARVLEDLDTVLSRGTTAAVFLEAIQGSGGGASVDASFCHHLRELCTRTGTLLVADEILTGFYRTGPLFFHERFPLDPDIILAGKCMGNGFPVSTVLMRRDLEIRPQMLPYSTYADNSLAAAAVSGTLREIERLPLEQMAARVEHQIADHLNASVRDTLEVTLFGALCIINTGDAERAQRIADRCYEEGVLISQAGPILRLLPPVTIEEELLEAGLNTLDEAIAASM